MAIEIQQIKMEPDRLGEGPLWDPQDQVLYWVDILGCKIRCLDPATGEIRDWLVPDMIGCMALRESGGAVVAAQSGFYFFDFESGATTPIVDPEAGEKRTRFNDGKVDRQGRFLAGSINLNGIKDGLGLGSLYRLNTDLSLEVLRDNVVLSNGPCFSPDGGTFYFADTAHRTIWAYDYDGETGALSHMRTFIDLNELDAVPDGATVDSEGCLWSTLVSPGQIGQFSAAGELLRRIDIPTDLPSSVMFGGPDLDILYVTSIRESRFFKSDNDSNGCLFAIHGLDTVGLPEPRFAG